MEEKGGIVLFHTVLTVTRIVQFSFSGIHLILHQHFPVQVLEGDGGAKFCPLPWPVSDRLPLKTSPKKD